MIRMESPFVTYGLTWCNCDDTNQILKSLKLSQGVLQSRQLNKGADQHVL